MSPFTHAPRVGRVAAALGLSIGVMVLAAAPAQADVPAGWSAAFSDSYSRTSAGSWGSDYTLSGATAQGRRVRYGGVRHVGSGQEPDRDREGRTRG